MPGLSGSINHLCKEQWLCVKGGLTRRVGGWGGGAERWVSGTGGRVLYLSHLGSPSPSALDRLICIHPPAQEGPRAHKQSGSLSHTLARTWTHAHSQTAASSMNCFWLLVLPRESTQAMLMHASSSISFWTQQAFWSAWACILLKVKKLSGIRWPICVNESPYHERQINSCSQ